MKDFDILEERISLLNDLNGLLYSLPGFGCGGPLHILLDDGNVRDSDIEFCRQYIKEQKHELAPEVCICMLDMLLTLSPAQRLLWWEYASIDDIRKAAGKDIISTDTGYKIKE